MIKTRMGTTEIKGSRVEIITDITIIFKGLFEEIKQKIKEMEEETK